MATRGPSSFSKRSPKLAVWQVILGKDGMILGRIDPWHIERVPCDPFGFLATRGWSLFRMQNPKTDVQGVMMGLNGMKPGSIGP